MTKLIVIEHLTLDGVMQSPGRPDEDCRDDFYCGGWGVKGFDLVMTKVLGARMGASWSLLVGRTTYDEFAAYWPQQLSARNPFAESLDKTESLWRQLPSPSHFPGGILRS